MAGLNVELDKVAKAESNKDFYSVLAKLNFDSAQVKTASGYFDGLVEKIVDKVAI